MPLVYVTGISASGKSTVLAELRRRGYGAYGMDEDGYGRWVDRTTGEEEKIPDDRALDLHRWIALPDWVVDIDKIAQLSRRAGDRGGTTFLCGVASGDADVWRYFDLVCLLDVDDATIRKRLASRTNVFGKRPDELAQILAWNVRNAERYRGFGAVIIDATQPPAAVADAIVSAVERRWGADATSDGEGELDA